MHTPAKASEYGAPLRRARAATSSAVVLGVGAAAVAPSWPLTASGVIGAAAVLLAGGIWIWRRAERRRQRFDELAAGEREILERIASGAPLAQVLERIVSLVEKQTEEATCSILLVDHEHGCLLDAAGASLPESYRRAIHQAKIGPEVGSCGRAAFLGERVIVEDIATHPHWEKFKHLALPHGLRACWSSPIFSPSREVLGTFAIYYREVRGPGVGEFAQVDIATHLAAIAIGRDQAGQALLKSEARYRQMVDTAYEGVWLIDNEARTTFANQRMAEMLGYTAEEMLGLSMFHFMDEAARAEAEKNFARRKTGVSEQHEFRFKRKDGADVWTLVAASPISDGEGRVSGALGMITDITERKAAEAALLRSEIEFRAAFENAAVGMVLVDRDGRPLKHNLALQKILGYTDEELCRLTVPALAVEEDAAIGTDELWEVMRGTRDGFVIEKRYRHREGRIVWGRVTTSAVREVDGALRFMLGLFEDITQQKEVEEERARLEAQLRQSQKIQSLGTLAGGIAHDFNNILNAVTGNIQLAHADLPEGHPALVSLHEIERAAGRASDLVRQILSFSRPQEPKRKTVDLRAIVEEALSLLRASLPASIAIRTEMPAEALAVAADATQIHQVIMNLGTNAAHAMSDHGGVFSLRLEPVTVDAGLAHTAADLGEGRYARLTVSDSGQGMDSATLERIFEPFFTTKSPGKGTGLGLSVVHGIVKGHGGTIVAQSQPGAGSTFQLYLPLASSPDAEIPTPAAPTLRGHGQRVLYLDDEERLVFLARRTLDWLGYQTTAFTEPAPALEAFRARPGDFDLVITDLTMPGMLGSDFARAVLSLRPEIPVLLTTGYLPAGEEAALRRSGVRQILLKPVTIDELSRALHHALEPVGAASV